MFVGVLWLVVEGCSANKPSSPVDAPDWGGSQEGLPDGQSSPEVFWVLVPSTLQCDEFVPDGYRVHIASGTVTLLHFGDCGVDAPVTPPERDVSEVVVATRFALEEPALIQDNVLQSSPISGPEVESAGVFTYSVRGTPGVVESAEGTVAAVWLSRLAEDDEGVDCWWSVAPSVEDAAVYETEGSVLCPPGDYVPVTSDAQSVTLALYRYLEDDLLALEVQVLSFQDEVVTETSRWTLGLVEDSTFGDGPLSTTLQEGKVLFVWNTVSIPANYLSSTHLSLCGEDFHDCAPPASLLLKEGTSSTEPAVVETTDGQIVLVAVETMSEEVELRGHVFSPEDLSLPEHSFTVANLVSDWNVEPSVASLKQGQFLVFWNHRKSLSVLPRVKARLFDKDGADLGEVCVPLHESWTGSRRATALEGPDDAVGVIIQSITIDAASLPDPNEVVWMPLSLLKIGSGPTNRPDEGLEQDWK